MPRSTYHTTTAKFIVPRLEHLAFTVSFEEILGNLVLCQDHRPKAKQLEIAKFPSFLSPEICHTSENLINYVRNRLDYHLEGLMSDETRKKYVEKFYKTCLYLNEKNIEPWVFLDCVLDESFKELETHAAFPGSEPDSRLISTIAECSSELQKLKIDFSLMMTSAQLEKVNPLISNLSSLKHLTGLNLHQLHDSHRSVLKHIGHACPLLTHLSISGFGVSEDDLFALIIGRFSDQLYRAYRNPIALLLTHVSSLEFLQVPPEILAPFCFTLRHLDLFGCCQISTATFALRHLPLLEKMGGRWTSFGVERLKYIPSNSSEVQKRKLIVQQFEEACKDALVDNNSTSIVHPTLSEVLLSLVSLDFVYSLSGNMLQVIGELCPQLKEVRFSMLSPEFISSRLNVIKHLKTWPKLENIALEKISPEYVTVILEAFASSLKSVTFHSCKTIKLTDLTPCLQLESLLIVESSSLDGAEMDPGQLSSTSFLPHLKDFDSQICITGIWKSWLEGKSGLTNLCLNCYHFGSIVSIWPDYTRIPKMWPKLEKLGLRQCKELKVSMVADMVRQLPKLKQLSLPTFLVRTESILAAKIWEGLQYRPSRVDLCFTDHRSRQLCSL